MCRRALDDRRSDAGRAAAIGDSLRDIGAARADGVWGYGVRGGHGCRDTARYPGGAEAAPVPDLMFDDVGDAVRFALAYETLAAPLVKAIRARAARPLMVGICGRSRSGKSVSAHALVRSLAGAAANP